MAIDTSSGVSVAFPPPRQYKPATRKSPEHTGICAKALVSSRSIDRCPPRLPVLRVPAKPEEPRVVSPPVIWGLLGLPSRPGSTNRPTRKSPEPTAIGPKSLVSSSSIDRCPPRPPGRSGRPCHKKTGCVFYISELASSRLVRDDGSR